MNAWQRQSFKRALLFAGSLVLVAATARPQCTMTVQFGASSNCGGLNWGATPINGTPPYSAQVSHGGMLLQSLVNVPANMLSGGAAPGGYAAASPGTDILLTDAMGCTVQATAMTPAVHAILPTLVLALDCFTGLGTLRCTGFTDAYAGGSPYAPCDWQGRPCSVAGVAVGTVASTWVNEGGGVWRYGQLLAGGTHNFIFGGTNLACNGALECWGNTLVTVASITPGDCGANVRVRALLQCATV